MVWIVCSLLLVTASIINSKSIMEAKIHMGVPADINKHAYSVFISVIYDDEAFSCGASILNQKILLTVAHCFDFVTKDSTTAAYVGHENHDLGRKHIIKSIVRHIKYVSLHLINDIALALLESPFILGGSIQRIALSKFFEDGHGEVAGWGIIDDIRGKGSLLLHRTEQVLMSRKECIAILKTDVPPGTICGGSKSDKRYPTIGDSGSAFVTHGFLQAGIVSHRHPEIDKRITVYTDIIYFYNWIKINSRDLYCNYNSGSILLAK